jgi:hypothetical protein
VVGEICLFLDVVDFDLLVVGTGVRLFLGVLVVGEIKVAFAFIARTVCIGLVDSRALGKLAVLLRRSMSAHMKKRTKWLAKKWEASHRANGIHSYLQRTSLVGRVLDQDISLVVLIIAEREKDDLRVLLTTTG